MLVDKAGKIVFKGHPANRPNLEQDLETLAADGTISGKGCAPAEGAGTSGGDDGEGVKIPEGMKEGLDADLINKEIDEFKVVADSFQKDEAI